MAHSRQLPFRLAAAGIAAALLGCQSAPPPAAPPKDGDLALPAGYKAWPKFLSAVQRPDAKQVREIYMNPAAASATPAAGFPEGTVFVMENYAVETHPDGTPKTGPDGKLVKAALAKVFVMGKGKGWGQDVAEPLKNGQWVYAAYLPNGDRSAENWGGCRACHAPLGASKDFVHRYDEYFAQRKMGAAERWMRDALHAGLPAAAAR